MQKLFWRLFQSERPILRKGIEPFGLPCGHLFLGIRNILNKIIEVTYIKTYAILICLKRIFPCSVNNDEDTYILYIRYVFLTQWCFSSPKWGMTTAEKHIRFRRIHINPASKISKIQQYIRRGSKNLLKSDELAWCKNLKAETGSWWKVLYHKENYLRKVLQFCYTSPLQLIWNIKILLS